MADPAAQTLTPPTGPAPSATQILLDRREPQRAALLEGLKSLRSGSEPVIVDPAAAQVTAPPSETPVEPAVPAEVPAEPAAEPEPEPTPAPDIEPPGMAAVRKAEQHNRQRLAAERATMQADFDAQKSAWQTKLDKAAELEAKIASARQDPLAAFRAMGFGDADFDAIGRAIYAQSPEGQKDPRNRAAAEAALAKRSQETAVEKLERELKEMRESQSTRDKEAQAHATRAEIYTGITDALSDEAPHARYLVGKNPRAAQDRLLAIGHRLWTQSGPSDDTRDAPDPREVLKAYETERATEIKTILGELAALGIDASTFGKPAPKAVPVAKPTLVAPPATAPAPTVAPAVTPTPASKPTPPDRSEVLAAIAKLRSGTA